MRSRRYHLSSGRTPYSKNRHQGQQGIISRVTDTVKSIVPSWLQKYFNKTNEVPSRNLNATEYEENVEMRESDLQSDIYVNDHPLPAGGRLTPQPVRIQEDSSASQLTLNVPDVLTRPSLHRANLNFHIMDSPALHCQPSTSSNFPIGPSGFSLVKEIKDSTSQHDDDNISTTSGFSSRASDKDVAVTKSVNPPALWSPEADRSHNSSMNSKKPTFNLSAFGALSSSLGNTSMSKTSQLGDSSFYPGKTTYGGAAAGQSSRVRGTPYQAPLRRQVKAKPANAQSYGVTSSTARRILQSLEKMSSPLADARRIPSMASPVSLTPENSILDMAEYQSKRKKVDSSYPPVQKLVTPKAISVSTNMSMYIKPSLNLSSTTNTSNHRTQIGDQHKEPRRNHMPDGQAPQQPESFSYPNFSTPASNGISSGGGRSGGKMMRERGTHYTTKSSDEGVDIPDLPKIPLPLSMAALPKFSICDQSKTDTPPATVSKPASNTAQTINLVNSTEFTFSSPIVKSTDSNTQSPGSSVGFTFSAPAMKISFSSPDKNYALGSPAKSPAVINSSSKKDSEEDRGGFCKPAKTLKEGSVLDILRSPGFARSTTSQQSTTTSTKSIVPATKTAVTFGESNKQALGIWFCAGCLLENKASDHKCVSCATAKDLAARDGKQCTLASTATKNTTSSTGLIGFGDHFKPAPGTWDCDTCLVQNKSESAKCVACETPKPGTGAKAALILLPTAKSDDKSNAPIINTNTAPSLKFQELAKRPVGSWECTVCLVQNKSDDSKCVACTSQKPGNSLSLAAASLANPAPVLQGQLGLLNQFKPPAGSWDCDVCLVQNKADSARCVACQSTKPGANTELSGFGTPAPSTLSASSTLPTIKFGLSSSKPGEFKSSSSMDSTKNTNTCTSGFSSFPKYTGEIKFGISSPSKSEEKKDQGLTLAPAAGTSSPAFKFGFGISASSEKDGTVKPLTNDSNLGTMPNTASTVTKTESSGIVQTVKEKPNLAVSFGLNEPGDRKNETPVPGGFTFSQREQKENPPAFVFGRIDDKTDSVTSGSSMFGSKNDGEQSKQFVFGKIEQAKADTPTTSFSFGAKDEVNQTAKPMFTFGLSATPADAGTQKQAFGFQSNGSSGAPRTNSSGSSSNIFCSGLQSSTQTSSSIAFSSAIQTTAASVTSGFTVSTQASASAPASNAFNNPTPLATPAGSGNLFGNAISSNSSVSSSSMFGTDSSTPVSSASVFGSTIPLNTTNATNVFGVVAPVSTSSSSTVFGIGAPPSTSASSNSLFGSSSAPTNPSTGTFIFGQPTTTASGSLFGSTESKPAFVFSGQENKPAVTPASTAPSATPFVFGASANTTPAATGFNFTGTNTSNSTGTSSTPFIFGATPAAPAASGLSAPSSVPAFGKNPSQNTAPAFGSSSTALFSGSSQSVPAFGSLTSNAQTPVFGQQSNPPTFGSTAAPASGSGFQFGNTNTGFNFPSGNSPGVFTFGTNTGTVPPQPPNSGFVFNQPPTFNMGTNGRTATPSTISARKIKTARRRK